MCCYFVLCVRNVYYVSGMYIVCQKCVLCVRNVYCVSGMCLFPVEGLQEHVRAVGVVSGMHVHVFHVLPET